MQCVPPMALQAHLHHYSHVEGMDMGLFSESLESLNSLVGEYQSLEAFMDKPHEDTPRLRIC